jgi:ribonuclease E
MTINDESEGGWDALAEDLGVEATQPAEPKERPAPAPRRPAYSPPPAETEEPEGEFGTGVSEDELSSREPLYDPGPDTVSGDSEDFEDSASETFEDEMDEGLAPAAADEEQEGGKRRRRRRRRRKKGAQGAAEIAQTPPDVDATDTDAGVEEGEAPAELESDEEEVSAPASAMDEEIEEEVAQFRNDWHVMTWADLVSKLYRPA